MLHRSAETATYPGEMAKVEIDLSEDLLGQIDEAANRAGESRDEFLRRSVEEAAARSRAALRQEIEDLIGPAKPRGGNAAEIIREMRDNHPPMRRGNRDEA